MRVRQDATSSGRSLEGRRQRSRSAVWVVAAIVAAVVPGPFGQLYAQTDEGPDTRPNIVVFLSDDMGWGQPGFNGGTEVATPAMDRIANEGVKLTQFYVQPVCSPTRAALLTGRYPWKNGMEYRSKARSANGMLVDERTIAQELREAGYATWMLGKWHLGQWRQEHLPLQRGFDHHYGFYSALVDPFTLHRGGILDWHRNGRPVVESGYADFLLAGEAVQLIDRHDGTRPFFLYLAFGAVHEPHGAPEEYIEQYKDQRHPEQRAMLKAMDVAMGRVMDALEQRGMLDDTLLVFLNDNGGTKEAGRNAPYRGLKESYWEGGIRSPAALRWPGRIPPGSESDALLHVVDLFPTFVRLARADGDDAEEADTDSGASQPLDGLDAWEAIAEGAESPREEVVYSLDVIRMGDWKLIDKETRYYTWESKYLTLYNIREDPGEQRNRAVGKPDMVAQLLRRLAHHRQFARDPEPVEEIPDFPPVVYGSDEQATFGAEVQTALSELDNGNPGPTLVRTEASGDDLRLVYDQALDADSVPPADAFRVVVNPEYRSAEVAEVEMNGSEVWLTLTQSLRVGETVGLTYEVPVAGAIRDADGIAAVGVTWVETAPVAPGSLLAEVAIVAVSSPVTEGTAAVFDVSLGSAASEALTVAVSVTETGATLSGMPPASVRFAAGATEATLSVATEADAVVEDDSTVTATLAAGDGYTLGDPATASVVVTDDDDAELAASFDPAEVAEGGSATLTVEIANGVTFAAEQSVALSYAGTASAADHDGPSTLALAAGASSASATVSIADDEEQEDAETLTVSAAGGGESIASATLTIAASDAPLADDAALSALSLSGIALTFEADVLDYAVDAPPETTSTTVTATRSDPDATVEIDGAAGTERTLPLAVGGTTIGVTVTAEDGATSRAYAVTVTRARASQDFEGLAAAGNGRPRGIWSDGETLWVVDPRERQLYAYSMATGQRLPERDRATGAQGWVQGIWSDGATTWLLDSSGNEARAYRQSDWRRRGSRDIALAAGNDLATGGWGDGATLWVAEAVDGRAYAYSLAYGTRDAAKDIDLGPEAGVLTTALWSGDGRRFLAGRGGRAELRGHTASGREPSADLTLAADNRWPAGMWSDGATLWVSDQSSDKVHAYALAAKTPNATLTVLRVEGVHIGRYAPRRTSYAATVPHGTTTATVTAWPAQGAAVTYDVADADPDAAGHEVDLDVGANPIGVTATAADGTSRTYAVILTRLGAGETRALTAAFEDMPDRHDDEPFGFELRFSESPSLGYRELRDEALAVLGGTVLRARRLTAGSNAGWAVTVAPDGDGDVELSLVAELACGEAGAVCTADGRRLADGPTATVAGPAPQLPEIAVAADAPAVTEGAPATFTLTRTGAAAETLAVALSVAESASMLAAAGPAQVEFAAGSATATLTLATDDDRVVEDPSTVTVTLSTGTGYAMSADAGSAQVSVADNDAAVFAVTLSPAEVVEGASATLTVSLGDGVTFAAAQEIGLALSGTASAADYTLSAGGVELSAPYALTLAAGADSTAATLAVLADALAEPEETVTVAASHDGAEVGTATATIPADAAPASDDATLTALTLSGIDIGAFASVTTDYTAAVAYDTSRTTVTATPTDAGATVTISDGNGSTAGTSRTVALAVGASAITVTVDAADGIATRTYTVTVTRAASPPTVSIAAGASPVAEGGSVSFRLDLDGAAPAALTVAVAVSETASALSATASSVVFAQGDAAATLTLATDDDHVVEDDSTVTVTLLAGGGYTLGAGTAADVVVEDNDAATFDVSVSATEIEEGDAASVTVEIANGVVFAAEQAIVLSTSGTATADDYALSPTPLVLAAGQRSAVATLSATDDAEEEAAETVTVLASLGNVTIGSVTVTVSASDAPASDDAALSALALSEGDIGPFDADTTAYSASVAEEVSSTTITATPSDPDAGVTLTDADGSTAGTSRTTSLSTGDNAITAMVTAADAATTRAYAVTVTRAPAWGTRLGERDVALPGMRPTGLWSDGQTLWAVDADAGEVRRFRLSDGTRLDGTVSLTGPYAVPWGLWSDGETLLVSDYGGGVRAYGLSAGERRAQGDLEGRRLAAAGNGTPTGVWSDGTTAWVANHADGKVHRYRLSDTLHEGTGHLRGPRLEVLQPGGLWSDGETLLATDWYAGTVRAYRLSDFARLPERDIAGESSENVRAAGLWSDGATLWVADETQGRALAYAVPGLRRSKASGAGPFVVRVASRAAPVPADGGRAVRLADAGLRTRLAAALGRSAAEPLGERHLAALVSLDAGGAGVRDLAGLAHAPNLEALDLSGSAVADLRPLAALPRLATLKLDGAAVDPWALSGLSGLRALSLRDAGLEDIAALASLTGLEHLDLAGNPVADLSPLAGLADLAVLQVDAAAAAGLGPLGTLGGLRALSLRAAAEADLSPLARLRLLRVLDLRDAASRDLSPLAGNDRLRIRARR